MLSFSDKETEARKLTNLPKVIQLISVGPRIWTQAVWDQRLHAQSLHHYGDTEDGSAPVLCFS